MVGLYYYSIGAAWSLAVSWYATIGAPLLGLVLIRRRRWDLFAFQCFGFLYMAMIAINSQDLITRYLTPLSIVLVLGVIEIVDLVKSRRRASAISSGRADPSASPEAVVS